MSSRRRVPGPIGGPCEVRTKHEPNGSKYVSQRHAGGERHDRDVHTLANVSGAYYGQWKDSLTHGRGVFTDSDGTRYDSEWQNGECVTRRAVSSSSEAAAVKAKADAGRAAKAEADAEAKAQAEAEAQAEAVAAAAAKETAAATEAATAKEAAARDVTRKVAAAKAAALQQSAEREMAFDAFERWLIEQQKPLIEQKQATEREAAERVHAARETAAKLQAASKAAAREAAAREALARKVAAHEAAANEAAAKDVAAKEAAAKEAAAREAKLAAFRQWLVDEKQAAEAAAEAAQTACGDEDDCSRREAVKRSLREGAEDFVPRLQQQRSLPPPPPPPVGLAMQPSADAPPLACQLTAPSATPTPPPAHTPLAEGGAAFAVRNGAAPLCDFDPLLSAFLEHLRLQQHLPVLADEEISLDMLRLMLSSGELETSLTELGIKRSARFKIEHGLRFIDGFGDIPCAVRKEWELSHQIIGMDDCTTERDRDGPTVSDVEQAAGAGPLAEMESAAPEAGMCGEVACCLPSL